MERKIKKIVRTDLYRDGGSLTVWLIDENDDFYELIFFIDRWEGDFWYYRCAAFVSYCDVPYTSLWSKKESTFPLEERDYISWGYAKKIFEQLQLLRNDINAMEESYPEEKQDCFYYFHMMVEVVNDEHHRYSKYADRKFLESIEQTNQN